MTSTLDRRILLLSLATFATGTEAYVYAGLLSDVASELQIDLGQAGLLATAFAVTYAVLAPFLASLTAAWPRRPVLTTGLAVVGLINLAAAWAPSFEWLLASRIACGAVAAIIGPSATAIAVMLAPTDMRGRAMATVAAGMSLAFTLGVPLGSAVGGVFGWRATFVFAGLLLLACAAAIRLIIPPVSGAETSGIATLKVVRLPPVALRLVLTMLVFAATFSSVAFLGPIANAVAGAHGFGVGLFQACIGLGSIAGILIGGRLADRLQRERYIPWLVTVIIVTQLGYGAAQLPGLGVVPASILLALAILVGAAALFALMPIIQVGLITASPDRRNVVLALNGSMVFFGQGLGAAIGAAAIGFLGVNQTGLVGAAIATMVASAAAVLTRRHARRSIA